MATWIAVSGVRDKLITEHPMFLRLGPTGAQRRSSFCSLFEQSLDADTLKRIRDAANTDSALGDEKFLVEAENLVGRRVRTPVRGRPAQSRDPIASVGESGKLF